MNGAPHTVVGVMPPEFRFPGEDIEIWGTVRTAVSGMQRHNRFMLVLGRLQAGLDLGQARSAMDVVTARLNVAYPESNQNHPAHLASAHETLVGDVRPALLALLGSVGLVLPSACANVGNLLLVRASRRRRETSLHAALGAGPYRLIRQSLLETLLLAACAGALALLLAHWCLRLLLALYPGDLPRLDQVRLDAAILGFTVLVSLGVGLLLECPAVTQSVRSDLLSPLAERGRTVASGRRGRAPIPFRRFAEVRNLCFSQRNVRFFQAFGERRLAIARGDGVSPSVVFVSSSKAVTWSWCARDIDGERP